MRMKIMRLLVHKNCEVLAHNSLKMQIVIIFQTLIQTTIEFST